MLVGVGRGCRCGAIVGFERAIADAFRDSGKVQEVVTGVTANELEFVCVSFAVAFNDFCIAR